MHRALLLVDCDIDFFALFYFYIPKCKPKKKDEVLFCIAHFTSSIRQICDISHSTGAKGDKSDQVVYG